jgi:methylated-DNA-[protein]-cysteine S-methyltransferase
MIYINKYQSPLGTITMAGDDEHLMGLWFDGQKYFAASLPADYEEKMSSPLRQSREWLDIYFSGNNPDFMPPLQFSGSPFRREVWNILTQIPYGEVMTYGDIAKRLMHEKGLPTMSAQAVGGAVGHNPISIIVPCHRVVGSNGSLTGYAGGIERKLALLKMEHIDTTHYFIPKTKSAT